MILKINIEYNYENALMLHNSLHFVRNIYKQYFPKTSNTPTTHNLHYSNFSPP